MASSKKERFSVLWTAFAMGVQIKEHGWQASVERVRWEAGAEAVGSKW